MITLDEVENINAGRKLIADSFKLKHFQPEKDKYGDILVEYQEFIKNRG